MSAGALSPVQYFYEGFRHCELCVLANARRIGHMVKLRRSKFNSGDSRGRMAELSRGNPFAGRRCPLPSR
jgi:hypothetical protein